MDVSSQLHAPAALVLGKQPPVTIEQKVRWTPESVLTFWRREKPLALARIEPQISREGAGLDIEMLLKFLTLCF